MYNVVLAELPDYSPKNVNEALDRICEELGFDVSNPFASFIKPGMTVFIKPKKYDVPCEIIDMRPLVCKDLKDYGQKR